MAYKVAVATGDWSAAGTWNTAMNTPGVMASSSNVTVTTTGLFTETVTGDGTSSITGVVVMPIASWTGKNITFQLQAGGVDVPGAAVVVAGADVRLGQPLHIKLITPILTTGAVVYRWKVSTSTSTCTVASFLQGNTTTIAALVLRNTTGAPVSGDFVSIGPINAAADITVTIDDTSAVMGDGTAFSVFAGTPPIRTWNHMAICASTTYKAELIFKATANTKLSWKSGIDVLAGAKWTQKPDSSHRSDLDMNAGSALSPLVQFLDGSLCDIQDSVRPSSSLWRTTVVSGLGTAASPLVTAAAVNWNVGDRVVVGSGTNSATNYNECEERYVITKNSSTSYVLSSTPGGSETAFTYTHIGAHIFNITRNVKWSSATANSWHVNFTDTLTPGTNLVIRGMDTSGLNSSGSSARAGFCVNGTATVTDIVNYDNNTNAAPFNLINNAFTNMPQIERLFIGGGGSAGNSQDGRITLNGGSNKTFSDCWCVNPAKVGWKITGSNNIFNRCGAIGGGAGLPDLYSGWNVTGQLNVFNDCEAHAAGGCGILLYGDTADNTFNRFVSGTKAKNQVATVGSGASQNAYHTILLDSPTQVETVLMFQPNFMIEGSQVVFSNVNGTAYNNYRYSNNGSAQTTGSGLADTTVSPLGYRTNRLAPLTAVGYKFRYLQLARPNEQLNTFGKIWCNAAFLAAAGCTVTVDLYMPGHVEGVDAPDVSVTMTKTSTSTDANATYRLGALYSGTRPRYASIVITATNSAATASAYAYVGDILNATNDVTNLNTWYQGQPSTIMFEQLGDASANAIAVWADIAAYSPGAKGNNSDTTLALTAANS